MQASGSAAPSPDVAALQKSLDQAKSDFDSNFKNAMDQVAALIKQLDDALSAQRPVSPDERKVYEEALLLEARGNLRVMKNEAAREDFRKLLRLNPNFTSDTMTPRESQTLDEIRQNEMGSIELQGQPQGARITVNQQEIGLLQPITQRWWFFPGHYVVSIEKSEFAPDHREFDLAAKQALSWTDVQLLQLNIPLVLFFSQPSVEVWSEEKRLETSRPLPEVLQSLNPPLAQFAQKQVTTSGWDPAHMSAVVLPSFDATAAREIVFKKECFLPETRRFEIPLDSLRKLNEQTPLWVDPTLSFINLRPNQGILMVTSIPSPATVLLGGQSLGSTPLQQTVCAGKQTLVVRTAEEGYEAPIEVVREGTLSVEARLKPTLAAVIIDRTQAEGGLSTNLAGVADRLKATLNQFFVIPVKLPRWDQELKRLNLSAESLRNAVDAIDLSGQIAQPVPGELQQVARNFEASLLLLGFPAANDQTTWVLLSIESNQMDVVRVRGSSNEEILTALKQLNEPGSIQDALFQQDLGFQTIDTSLSSSPLVVTRVWPNSAAEQAGIREGDIILSVNGTKMDTRQLAAAISKATVGTRFALEIRSTDGSQKTVTAASTKEPVAWSRYPISDNTFFEHYIPRLRDALNTSQPTALANLMRLNLGVALMRGEQWAEALDALSKIAAGGFPSNSSGRITDATVQFLMGQCEEALGLKDKAKETYEKAAGSNCEWCLVDSIGVETASAAGRRRLALLGGVSKK